MKKISGVAKERENQAKAAVHLSEISVAHQSGIIGGAISSVMASGIRHQASWQRQYHQRRNGAWQQASSESGGHQRHRAKMAKSSGWQRWRRKQNNRNKHGIIKISE